MSRTAVLAVSLGILSHGLVLAPAAADVTIKLGTLAPRDGIFHQLLQQMDQAWRQVSGGQVRLRIYPGGTMGGESAMVRRMRVNQIQAGLLSVSGLAEIRLEVTGLHSMPLMFRTLDEVDHVGEQLYPELERLLLEKGFVVLFWADSGWVHFFSTQSIVRPNDLRRLKMFVTVGSPEQVDVMSAMGFKPVPLEATQIFPGLQTGLIDVAPMPPFFALAQQAYRPAPHMLQLNWAPLVGALVVNKQTWGKVDAGLRPALLKAAREAGARIKEAGRRESAEAIKTMQDKWGLNVYTVDRTVEVEWRALIDAVRPELRDRVIPPRISQKVKDLLAEYRATASSGRGASAGPDAARQGPGPTPAGAS